MRGVLRQQAGARFDAAGGERTVPRGAPARVRAELSAAVRAAEWRAGRTGSAGALAAPARGAALSEGFCAGGRTERTDRGDWHLGARERLSPDGTVARARHRAGPPGAECVAAAVARRRLRVAGERHADTHEPA